MGAAQSGDGTAVVELITRHPELLKYASHRRLSAAHFAACRQSAEVLQQLITKAHELQRITDVKEHHKSRAPHLVRDLVNAKSDRGVTPLMLAADKGCLASVKLLLDQVQIAEGQSHNYQASYHSANVMVCSKCFAKWQS